MKRCIIILLFLLVLVMPVTCLAAPAPLEKVSSSARISEETTVQAISYKARLKAEYDTTQVYSTIVLKNTDDKRANIMMGMPVYINQNTIKLKNLEVIMDGKKQRLADRRDRSVQEESNLSDIPSRWYTWNVSIEPGAFKVIDISYTTDNIRDENGTKSIFIPLEFFKVWPGTPQNIEISVDMADAPPYVLEPNPSVLPHDYDKKGRLNWTFSKDDLPANIQVYFRSIEKLASEYISANTAGDRSIMAITRAFESKSYYEVIELINQYLEANNETAFKNELLYLQALAHQGLYQSKEASDIFDKVESQPLFGELEGTFKNRIIYDKYYHMKSLLTDNTALYSYLDSTKNYIMGNALFVMWIEEEMSYLEPQISPEPEPSPTEQPPQDDKDTKDKDNEKELIKSITIGKYEISVEMLFLAVIALIIIIILILRRKRKHRNRGYLFRY